MNITSNKLYYYISSFVFCSIKSHIQIQSLEKKSEKTKRKREMGNTLKYISREGRNGERVILVSQQTNREFETGEEPNEISHRDVIFDIRSIKRSMIWINLATLFLAWISGMSLIHPLLSSSAIPFILMTSLVLPFLFLITRTRMYSFIYLGFVVVYCGVALIVMAVLVFLRVISNCTLELCADELAVFIYYSLLIFGISVCIVYLIQGLVTIRRLIKAYFVLNQMTGGMVNLAEKIGDKNGVRKTIPVAKVKRVMKLV